MRILRDRRGTAALEFVLVAVPFFMLMFGIIEVGRYAVTAYSLRTLASAAARSLVMHCYSDQMSTNASPSTCTTFDPTFNATMQQNIAPMLFAGSSHPLLSIGSAANKLTVTACFPRNVAGTACSVFPLSIPFLASVPAPSSSVVLPF